MAKKKGDVSAAIEAQKLEKGQKSDVKNMGEELQKEQKKKNAPLKQRSGKASFEVKAREDKVLSFGQKSGDDDSGTAGIVVKEWQRLPKQLLHEYCQRQKLPKVHLKLEGVDKRCRVIIPDPKGKSVNTRMFVIHNEENMSGRMLTEIVSRVGSNSGHVHLFLICHFLFSEFAQFIFNFGFGFKILVVVFAFVSCRATKFRVVVS